MPSGDVEDYWEPSFETLYDACFYELASERIVTGWSRINLVAGVLTAITASGSAFAGWTYWADPSGKIVWGAIAAFASLLAIVQSVLGVPRRIRDEEERRQRFSALRIDLETFRHNLVLRRDPSEAKKTFGGLRTRLSEYVSKTPPDIVFTRGARKAVQELVNEKLKKYIRG